MFYSFKFKSRCVFSLVGLILFIPAVRAAEKSTRLEPLDVFNLQFAADPQISPDGRRIVYVRQFSNVMTDKHYSNLWMIGFDGTDPPGPYVRQLR